MESTTIGHFGQSMGIGYPVRLLLVPADWLAVVMPSTQSAWEISGYDIELQPETICTHLKFRPKQCSFSEGFSRTPDGGVVSSVIETRLTAPDGLLMAWLMTASLVRWVAIVQLQDESGWLVGTPELPLVLTWSKVTGTPNDVRISLNGQNWLPAVAMKELNFETLGEGEFSIDFDLSFH